MIEWTTVASGLRFPEGSVAMTDGSVDDVFTTNICRGGADMRDAYVCCSVRGGWLRDAGPGRDCACGTTLDAAGARLA